MILELCINQSRCPYRLELAAYCAGEKAISNGFCPVCTAHTIFSCPACGRLNCTKYQMPELRCCECYAAVARVAARYKRRLEEERAEQEAAQQTLISAIGLSRREIEVFKLTALGLCNKEISERLGISLRTAEGLKTRLMLKTHLHSAVHLVHLALENHFVTSINVTEQVLAVRTFFNRRG
jgi:DNA-binding CsgD family transcriptional regulator